MLALIGCGGRSALNTPGSTNNTLDGGSDLPLAPGDLRIPDQRRPADLPRPDARWVDPNRPTLPTGARCQDGWCTIQPGTFQMGSPAWEPCRNWSFAMETRHQVTLTRAFELAATEVTQGQFLALMGYDPSSFKSCGKSCPAERVRWHEAAAYCNALSQKNGLPPCYSCSGSGGNVTCTAKGDPYGCAGYRLPTEAEWEYAYRAGSSTAYYNGDNSSCTGTDKNADTIAWYDLNAGTSIHPVAKKKPNAWGLYDMAGNAIEWTHDGCVQDLGSQAAVDPVQGESANGKVLKGGAWLSFVRQLRGAYRACGLPATRNYQTGFRCGRTL